MIFDALDWLASMCTHIPDQREQMVRYYGFYSNISRGLRQKENEDALMLLQSIDILSRLIFWCGGVLSPSCYT